MLEALLAIKDDDTGEFGISFGPFFGTTPVTPCQMMLDKHSAYVASTDGVPMFELRVEEAGPMDIYASVYCMGFGLPSVPGYWVGPGLPGAFECFWVSRGRRLTSFALQGGAFG